MISRRCRGNPNRMQMKNLASALDLRGSPDSLAGQGFSLLRREFLIGLGTDKDLGAELLVLALDAGGGIDGIADGRVVQPLRAAHHADDRAARVNADTDTQVGLVVLLPGFLQCMDAVNHFHCRADGPHGMVRIFFRCAEQHHHPVSHVLRQRSSVTLDDGHESREVVVQQGDHRSRGMAFGIRREIADVGEEHTDGPLLAVRAEFLDRRCQDAQHVLR